MHVDDLHIEDTEYEFEGTRLVGHLAVDRVSGGPRPAVLVCHEGPGLSDHAKHVAERLAGLGYVAFALDYHGGGLVLPREEMMTKLGAMMGNPDRIRGLAAAGLDQLLAQPEADHGRVAAIGYCFTNPHAAQSGMLGSEYHEPSDRRSWQGMIGLIDETFGPATI